MSRVPRGVERWLISLWIIFHSCILLITPNTENYFGYRLLGWIKPYIQLFEFSGQWQFFSPDPAPLMQLQWRLFDSSGSEIRSGTLPGFDHVSLIGDPELRRMSAMRFVLLQGDAVQATWVPYLCSLDPKAFSIRLSRLVVQPPLLAEVITGKKGLHDPGESNQTDLGLEFCGKN